MTERPDPARDNAPPRPSADESAEELDRAQWSSEDDELLLLDEIEESPDDDRIDDLV